MPIIIGLILALVLLFGWLSGHWFARVVTFLVLAVGFGLGIGVWLDHHGYDTPAPQLGMLGGFVLAWPVSSLPTYYRRRQDRNALLQPALR